ncbi:MULTISPECIES: hypothetical protein [unclassified Vibrio]|uniref:toxin-antitoxin system YwqK family antitoxin n=1 Tax=Vibrio TaxID=662 RepID=UPI00149351B0|nr:MULTISPECIES: hypothetical protein [unclassified Vibrio]
MIKTLIFSLLSGFLLGSSVEVVKEYYESGALKSVFEYRNGKREGIGRIYYESGNLKREFTYKKGKLDGIGKVYYEDGTVDSEFTYQNGTLKAYTKK